MMLLPLFLFLFQVSSIPIPRVDFNKWNQIIPDFIWNNRRQRIKCKTLLQQKEEGG